jgi:hypothetical protein
MCHTLAAIRQFGRGNTDRRARVAIDVEAGAWKNRRNLSWRPEPFNFHADRAEIADGSNQTDHVFGRTAIRQMMHNTVPARHARALG